MDDLPTTDPIAEGIAVPNPVMDRRAWFVHYDSSKLPIYIAEAACSAFATRFRQSLNNSRYISHAPRVHYIGDEQLSALLDSQISWPTKTHAQLCIKVAIAHVNRGFHVVMQGTILSKLNQAYEKRESMRSEDICIFFALFALGEVYSTRTRDSAAGQFPGLSYFMHACKLLQVLPERGSLEYVEALVLLVSSE